MATTASNARSAYAVGDIPPFRPKASRTSTDVTSASSTSAATTSATTTTNPRHQHLATSTSTRERRTSQASNNSGDSNSRRNSSSANQYVNSGGGGRTSYPSPAPSSPASSPTHVLAQFFPSSSTVPAGLSSLTSSSTSSSGNDPSTSQGYYANPALASSIGPGASSQQYYPASTTSPGLAMLQGIEAQLQQQQQQSQQAYNTRSNRNSMTGGVASTGGVSGSTSSSSSNSRRQSTGIPQPVPSPGLSDAYDPNASRVSGPTHRIPATHQTTHRPASTTIVPIQPSILHSPPAQYNPSLPAHHYQQQQQQHRQTPSHNSASAQAQAFLYSTNTAPQLSQSTRAPFPAPLMVPSASGSGNSSISNTNSVSAGPSGNNSRNRASHQIVPVSANSNAPPQIPTIALHTAQYSNPGRQKVFFGDYQLLHTLGEGEFGKVKLGVHAQRWGEEVAIKLIKKGNINDAARSLKVQREIDVLRMVRHPHIVRLVDVVETDRYIGIVLEYASGGELFEYILAHKHLRENVACKLFAQLVSGVGYLHSKKVVHRDLKLENLLLDRNRNIIITDFGFANRFNDAGSDLMATSCGSPCYAAPELVLQDGQYVGSAVDVWSCGVILYAMLSGYLPYDDDPNNPDGDNINLLYRYITTTRLSFPDWVSPEPRDLLLMMLVPDPNKRCSLKDVMRHPWLARYANFFRNTVADLEAQADAAYEEKRMLLQRQQEAYYRQLALNASTGPTSPQTAMARSMSTPGGVDGTMAQQRHRSAMVVPVTGPRPSMATQLPPMDEMSTSWARTSTTRSETMPFIDPFSAPVTPAAATPSSASGADMLSPASTPMAPSTSAPGDFEGTSSDSLVTEGDMRGEPRSRRTDDDDASTTSSARATRNAAVGRSSNVSSPSKSSSNGSSDTKRRKGDEKRHTVQLEYTSPPAESTRSKTKARESLNSSQVRVPIPALPSSVTSPVLPSFVGSPPALIPSEEFKNLPLIEATSAADNIGDVHMTSANTSPARSMQVSEENAAPSTPPLAAPKPVTPAQAANVEGSEKVNDADVFKQPGARNVVVQATPPTSPSRQSVRSNRTPRRTPAASSADLVVDTQRTPRASTQQREPEKAAMPFPSPTNEEKQPKQRPVTMAIPTIDRNASMRSQDSARPSISTQSSSRSSQRHRKGLSTDRAFFSRLLGNSTTSINRLDATGEGSRSRTSSSNDDRPALTPSQSTAPGEEFVHDSKRGAGRRKALSLVVDPFGRSSNGPASSGARNRRSTKIPVAAPIAESSDGQRGGSTFTQPTTPRTSNIPMSPSMPVTSSFQNVNQPLRQVPPSSQYNEATSSPFSTRTSDSNKSKRVSDWFRWKSVNRNSTAYQPSQAVPDNIKTDFDKPSVMTRSSSTRQKRNSVIQPKVIVTGATPQNKEQQRHQQQESIVTSPPRVVATPADARNLTNDQPSLLASQRALRARRPAAEVSKPVAFDDSRLKVASGVTDKRIVTKTLPPQILEEVRSVLTGMGIQVVPDSDFRLTCTRKSRKQAAALASSPAASSALSPSPGSTFRSFFSRKNSAATTGSAAMVPSPSMPSPALTTSSTMEGPESAGLSPTTSAQSQVQVPMPYYGSSHDSGGEVRFSVEVVRVKHLAGLYTLDFRRLKGALTDYKENHETCIERLKLGSAV